MAQKTLQVRLEAELYTTLDMLAARTGGDISKLTRRLLTEYAQAELAVIQHQSHLDAIVAEAVPAVISRRPNLTPLFTTVTPGEANADEDY